MTMTTCSTAPRSDPAGATVVARLIVDGAHAPGNAAATAPAPAPSTVPREMR